MASTDLTVYKQAPLKERIHYAEVLAGAADLIPRGLMDRQTGRPSPAKIFLVTEMGAMLGLAPLAAIQGIDVIEGKTALAPRLMFGLLRAAGHRVVIDETGSVAGGDAAARVTLYRKDAPDEPISGYFDMEMAVRAELVDSYTQDGGTGRWKVRAVAKKTGEPLPWQKWTEDMLVWRAGGRMARRGGMEELMGIGYIPEELEATIDEDGATDHVLIAERAAALTDEYKALDDKAKLAVFYHEHVDEDVWDQAFQAEFTAYVATVQKDSRPPRDGAPGHTGDPEVDADTGEVIEDAVIVDEPGPNSSQGEDETDEDYEARTAREFDEWVGSKEARS